MARSTHITRWNLLALLVVAVGAAGTLYAGHRALQGWAESGMHFPVGERFDVELPAGPRLVYYQSTENVVRTRLNLRVWDPHGAVIQPQVPVADNDFRVLLTGVSGKSLWKIDVPSAGAYTMHCVNGDFAPDEIPEGDRVVFLKDPRTLDDALASRRRALINGAVVTVLLTGILYGIHLTAVRRRLANGGDRA